MVHWRSLGIIVCLLLVGLSPVSAQPREALPPRIPISPETAPALTHYMQRPLRGDRVVWSPGGTTLAIVDSTDILLFSAADWLAEPLLIRLDQPIADVVFSADGRQVITASPGAVVGWSITDGSPVSRLALDASRIANSPDGRSLAALTRRGALEVWDLQARTGVIVAEPTTGAVGRDLAFTSDGRALVVESSGMLTRYDLLLRQSEIVTQVPPASASGRAVALTADGRRAVVATGGPFALSALDLRGDSPAIEFALPAEYQRINGWSLNTRARLTVAAGIGPTPEGSAVLVWDLSAGGAPLARLRHAGVRDAAANRDASMIASIGGGTLRLWALESSLPTVEQARLLADVAVVAACDSVGSVPTLGSIIGGQRISLVWSWYARTPQQVRDYLDAAQYQIEVDGQSPRAWLFFTQTLPDEVNDGLPTVYVFAPIGTLASGSHQVGVQVTWTRRINDGFADYGPGTAAPSDGGTCNFSAS